MNKLGVLLGPAFVNGNRIRALLNGDETFPPLLAAICSAKASITLETYSIGRAIIGCESADALADQALHGHVRFGSPAYVRYRTYAASVDAYRSP